MILYYVFPCVPFPFEIGSEVCMKIVIFDFCCQCFHVFISAVESTICSSDAHVSLLTVFRRQLLMSLVVCEDALGDGRFNYSLWADQFILISDVTHSCPTKQAGMSQLL